RRLPGGPHCDADRRAAREGRPQGRREGGVGHAPEEPPRSPDAEEAQGLLRPRPPARGPAGQAVRDHADLPVSAEKDIFVTENVTEVEETFETNDEGVAYTSESAPSADAPERPATIAPAQATGRRKEAVARVRIVPGTGEWTVNGRSLDSYFPNKLHQQVVREPF